MRPTRGDGSWVLARVRRRVDETRGEDVVARARGCRGWFLQDVVARALAPRVQSPAGRVVRVDARDGEPPSPSNASLADATGAGHGTSRASPASLPARPSGRNPHWYHAPARIASPARAWTDEVGTRIARGETTTTRGVGARRAEIFSLVRDTAVRGEGFPMPPQSKALADRSRRRRWASRRRRRSARRSRLLIYASSSRRLGWTPQAPSPPCWSAWRRCASSRATRRVFPQIRSARADARSDPSRAAPRADTRNPADPRLTRHPLDLPPSQHVAKLAAAASGAPPADAPADPTPEAAAPGAAAADVPTTADVPPPPDHRGGRGGCPDHRGRPSPPPTTEAAAADVPTTADVPPPAAADVPTIADVPPPRRPPLRPSSRGRPSSAGWRRTRGARLRRRVRRRRLCRRCRRVRVRHTASHRRSPLPRRRRRHLPRRTRARARPSPPSPRIPI